MRDLSRNVTMLCPLCGNDQFESVNEDFEEDTDMQEDARFRCSDCGSEYTRQELIEANSEVIESTVEDIGDEAVKEIERELKKAFKRWKF